MKKHLLPPLDEDLASAERTEMMRQQRALDDQAEEDRAERLALAGEPEAAEALRATAAFLHSQPLEPPKTRQAKLKLAMPKVVEEPPEPRPLTGDQDAAFKLLHLSWEKWANEFKQHPQEACIDLAINMGRNWTPCVKNGIWKAADGMDVIAKALTMVAKSKSSDGEVAEDYDAAIDKLRAEMRG